VNFTLFKLIFFNITLFETEEYFVHTIIIHHLNFNTNSSYHNLHMLEWEHKLIFDIVEHIESKMTNVCVGGTYLQVL
jgi:hypothetical protein